VAQACNPRYLRGRDWKDHGSRTAQEKVLNSTLTTTKTKQTNKKSLRKINLKRGKVCLIHSYDQLVLLFWICVDAEHHGRERVVNQRCSPLGIQEVEKREWGRSQGLNILYKGTHPVI
jgi:hypothetical protein